MKLGIYDMQFGGIILRRNEHPPMGWQMTDIKRELFRAIQHFSPHWLWRRIKHLFQEKQDKKQLEFKNRNFDSFYDTSLGEQVWNMDQIRRQEKRGRMFLRRQEAQKVAHDARAHEILESAKKSRKEIAESVRMLRHQNGVNEVARKFYPQ